MTVTAQKIVTAKSATKPAPKRAAKPEKKRPVVEVKPVLPARLTAKEAKRLEHELDMWTDPIFKGDWNSVPAEVRAKVYRPAAFLEAVTYPPFMWQTEDGENGKVIRCDVILNPSWSYVGGITPTHEMTVYAPAGVVTVEGATTYVFGEITTRVRRCYCPTCLCDTGVDSAGVRAARDLARLRRDTGLVNGVPLDGHPDNEAKLDTLLKVPAK